MDKNISLQDIARYDASFNANRVNKIAMNAAIYNGVKPASKSWLRSARGSNTSPACMRRKALFSTSTGARRCKAACPVLS